MKLYRLKDGTYVLLSPRELVSGDKYDVLLHMRFRGTPYTSIFRMFKQYEEDLNFIFSRPLPVLIRNESGAG